MDVLHVEVVGGDGVGDRVRGHELRLLDGEAGHVLVRVGARVGARARARARVRVRVRVGVGVGVGVGVWSD